MLCALLPERDAGAAAAIGDDFGHDGECDFFGADGADVEADRGVNLCELFLRNSRVAQAIDNDRRAAFATNQTRRSQDSPARQCACTVRLRCDLSSLLRLKHHDRFPPPHVRRSSNRQRRIARSLLGKAFAFEELGTIVEQGSVIAGECSKSRERCANVSGATNNETRRGLQSFKEERRFTQQ